MIDSITIANVASYASTPTTLSDLSKVNFLFGSNATGKTTVSRIIADEASFPTCRVTWKVGTKLEPMVYNQDFLERNFSQSTELKGVFTLGTKQVDTLAKIEAATVKLDTLTTQIETLAKGLKGTDGEGGKIGELANLEARLKDRCWDQKLKHQAKFKGAFKGYLKDTEKFKIKLLQELASNTATLQTEADLERRAETVFGVTPMPEAVVAAVDIKKLITYETNPILKKQVIGKENVDIAMMIQKLGNSDWVRQGREFYDVNDSLCPFCQQKTDESFAQSLTEYFDETFVLDSATINDLATNYETDAAWLQGQLLAIIGTPSKFLDIDKLKMNKNLLDTKITVNMQRLEGKKKEASQVVELDSVANVATEINGLIFAANTRIAEHNRMIANLETERIRLTDEVWKFVLEEFKPEFSTFMVAKDAIVKAINSMEAKSIIAKAGKREKIVEIQELGKQTTSIQPTIDGINQLLISFGFQSFNLAKGASGTTYKLVRSDGSDAKSTLSEGEKAFITFLYFYHLLKGSVSESGLTANRVVVFDDPVSSLDSDTLFIISSLIKTLFEDLRAGTGCIKQIFILTHNVYFHKEVTYKWNQGGIALKDETFWIVRKIESVSRIQKYPTNPIKTSYDLLWAEVRETDQPKIGIQNTLRRILEYYFKLLGGYNLNSLCDLFDGNKKITCRSLCSWMHDGSHNVHDDLNVSIDESMVLIYIGVFREIFEKTDHAAHYKMMMGESFVEQPSIVDT